MNCVICGHEKVFASYRFGEFAVRCCGFCGHGVLDPMPTSAELATLYDTTYFSDHFTLVGPDEPKQFADHIAREDHRLRSVRRFVSSGRLLDVGCGPGYFLYACKSSFAVTGFDPSRANRKFFRDSLDVELVHEFDQLSGRKFDMITFWHSLEHCPDPRAELARFAALLAPGGALIVDVPDHHSIDACLEGEKWPGWDVPFHCHHFTTRSLERLVGQLGLRIIGRKTYHCGHIRNQLARFTLLSPFARPLAKLFAGSAIMLALRPESSG
jgi:SAM-dependent methyltransferase